MADSRPSFLGPACCLSFPIFYWSQKVCLGTVLNQAAPGDPWKATKASFHPLSPPTLISPLWEGGGIQQTALFWDTVDQVTENIPANQPEVSWHHPYSGRDDHTTESTQSQLPAMATAHICFSPYPHAYQVHNTCAPCWTGLLGTSITGFCQPGQCMPLECGLSLSPN